MASTDDVKKLATLARLKVSDEELPKFAAEFESILAYVGQINALQIPESVKGAKPVLKNVMREDGVPHEMGLYTNKLVEQFPESDDNYLVVKKIVSND